MGWVAVVLAFVALAVGINACAVSIASDSRARNAVENLGYQNVRVESKGYSWGVLGGCGEKDEAKFRVSGTPPNGGPRRTLTVCASMPFGGYTVRG